MERMEGRRIFRHESENKKILGTSEKRGEVARTSNVVASIAAGGSGRRCKPPAPENFEFYHFKHPQIGYFRH